ncbi:MAG: hypothetical protein WEB58_20795 [Planctomycetaceae bacterium]
MKKIAFFALLVCGLVASLFVRSSISQDDGTQPRVPSLNLDTTAEELDTTTAEELDADEELISEVEVPNPLTPLRKELVELTQKRVETMTEDELKAELDRMQKQLAEYNAKAKLKEAEEILNAIVKNYPETPAAIQASQMLNLATSSTAAAPLEAVVPFDPFEADGFKPLPDPVFLPKKN